MCRWPVVVMAVLEVVIGAVVPVRSNRLLLCLASLLGVGRARAEDGEAEDEEDDEGGRRESLVLCIALRRCRG